MRANKISILYLSMLVALMGCNGQLIDSLEKSGENNFCPGTRLIDGTCPYADSSLSKLSWSFSSAGNYTHNTNNVEIASGAATLKEVDQFFSGTDFKNGTHLGTYLDSNNNLTLNSKWSDSLNVKTIFPTKVNNLIGYWKFDGDTTDSSGNSNHLGAIAGFTTDSKIGREAGDFQNNASARISNSSMMPSSKLTFTAWVKADSASEGVRVIAGNAEAGGNPFTVLVRNIGTPIWRVNLTQSNDVAIPTIWSSSNIILGKWTHLAVVADGTNVNLYVDGEFETSQPYNGTIKPVTTCWGIGARPRLVGCNATDQRFSGQIDEVSLWNDSLTSIEVARLFKIQAQNYKELSETWTPKYSNIVGYWKMDGNWKDSSGNGNDATAIGDTTFSSDSKVGIQSSLFDGTGDYLQVSDNDSLDGTSKLSISLWVNPSLLDGMPDALVTKRSGNNVDDSYGIFFFGGNVLCLDINGSYNRFCTNKIFEIDQWYHISVVYDGSLALSQRSKIYINGVIDVISTETSTSIPNHSSTLTFGTLNSGYTNWLNGRLDEIAIWKDAALSSSEVSTIYNRQKQKYAGHYDSPVVDLGASGSWTSLKAITTLPFLKELTGTNENNSDYSSLGGGLSSGLVGKWSFNETVLGGAPGSADIIDTSGAGNHGTVVNSSPFVPNGAFDGAINLITANKSNVNFGSDSSLDFTGDFTFSSWIYLDAYPVGLQGYLFGKGDYFADGWLVGIIGSSSSCSGKDGSIYFNGGNGGYLACTSKSIPLKKWSHILVKYESTNIEIYIDGELVGTQAAVTINFNDTFNMYLGKRSPDSWHLNASIDEVAVWNRAINSTELSQLYRRGANRLRYQIRSCDDIVCDTESFLGPDGTAGTYFSELHNNTTINGSGEPTGDVKTSSPNFTFSDFVSAPSNNRYFQYRVYMESDDENNLCSGLPCMPELTSVELGPIGRYFGGTPTVVTNSPITYEKINSITISESGTCSIGYQLSKDGTNFYFWNGTAWAAVSGDLDRSPKIDISTNIKKYSSQLGAGNLYVKAYLISDTSQSCRLNDISIENTK